MDGQGVGAEVVELLVNATSVDDEQLVCALGSVARCGSFRMVVSTPKVVQFATVEADMSRDGGASADAPAGYKDGVERVKAFVPNKVAMPTKTGVDSMDIGRLIHGQGGDEDV